MCIQAAYDESILSYPSSNANPYNQWSVRNTGDGEFYIINYKYRKCLTQREGLNTNFVSPCEGLSSQLFRLNSIVGGRYLQSLTRLPSRYSFQWSIADYSLRFEECKLRVYNPSNTILWSTTITSLSADSRICVLKILEDGDVCVLPYFGAGYTFWCSGSRGMRGAYFAFLPPYSYGREFGVVVLDYGYRLVWGQFGKAIIPDASYILIPGNFMDRLNGDISILFQKWFISNGREYFEVNDDGRIGLSYFNHTTVWSTLHKENLQGRFMFEFKEDTNACIVHIATGTSIFCTTSYCTSNRYVQIPLLDSFNSGRWGWVVLDNSNKITYAQFYTKQQHQNDYSYGTAIMMANFK